MRAADFDFDLPPDRIAQVPAARRTGSRLLHLPADGAIVHRRFADLPDLLRAGDLLVLNETRVIPARLDARRETGGAVEVFLVRAEGEVWRALVRPAKRLRVGERLLGGVPGSGEASWSMEITALEGGEARVAFPDIPAEEILDGWGRVPLPPYVRRDPTDEDRERYQTVFARVPGAVAAPTAGLHFDDTTLDAIRERGVEIARLVLHVGPGTFRPLPDGDLEDHVLDEEAYRIPDDLGPAIARAHAVGGRVVAVGTTVVRALEAAARKETGSILPDAPGATASAAPIPSGAGRTRLFVRPPFRFRVVDCLLTNFHLPKSSLLCLVSAFSGRERILDAYRTAVEEGYRFYSYGDATFLERCMTGRTESADPADADADADPDTDRPDPGGPA